MEFRPHPYQRDAIAWAVDHPRCGLLLPMGAGKTVITLTAISEMLYVDVAKVLIIGPVRVIESTWPDEIGKWEHTRDIRYSVISGTPEKRRAAVSVDADIYLIGKENVVWLTEQYGKNWKWDMVVIDELSTFKNPKAKRFRALRRMMPLTDRFIGLTGTPAPKGIPDLWSQIYLMDRGERLGSTLSVFRSRYLEPGRRNGMVVYEWRPKPDAEQRIYDRLSDICMSIRQGDCAKLPPVSYIDYPVDLGKHRKKYEEFRREKVLALGDDDALIAANAGVLCGQLLQYCSGEIYREDHSTEVIHDVKLNALSDLVESANGQPVMVFYYFRHELERIRNHFQKEHIVRTLEGPEDIAAWNRGEIDILLIHPASAGHGLNLQEGGCTAIWYTLPNWNLELYQQANARIYRQGQKKAVTIYHILARDTIDMDQLDALQRKDVTQKRLIEALRRSNEKET